MILVVLLALFFAGPVALLFLSVLWVISPVFTILAGFVLAALCLSAVA